ncbi:hypothetical protein I2F17_10810 [Acinetobacter sp. B10A]|uniref:3-hydroxyacyl-CoA dehydrogenase NAD-binding domain-containing protein n=1 Tax=Acinetobacter baretiae TaxID=2605383 RepID=UPI001B3C563E|nr:3-hydroxyacyl-CoA dehydrogenase NAD-binding domain-containing protein [Acinetobacter baretiae]MBF7686311.1 hypothetical protein [Acinetobacter baretiae]
MIYNGPAISIQRLEHNIAALRFKLPQDNTPLFHTDVFNDLDAALDCLDNERLISGLILVDIQCTYFPMCQYYQQQLQHSHTQKALTHFQTQLNRIEDYAFPTIALLEHDVFGPAAEIALCCDYRIVTPQARLFFAAQTFGQSPLLGASVRLPRLIGLEHAINVLHHDTPYSSETLLDLGLADLQSDTASALACAVEYIQLKQQQPKPSSKLEPIRLSAIAQFMVFEHLRMHTYTHKTVGHYPAYQILLDTLEQSVSKSRLEAQELEQHAYMAIVHTWQAQSLTLQSATRYTHHLSSLSPLQTVAIVVNTYHSWITHLLKHGLHVYLSDTGAEFDHTAFTTALMNATDTATVSPTSQLSYCRYSPLNIDIECVFDLVHESLNDKAARLNQIQSQLSAECKILVESTVLSLQTLTEQLKQPTQVCLTHQVASPHRMPLVEVVTHHKVSQDTLDQIFDVLQQLGKTPILVNQKPDLFSQRILNGYITVFADLISEGIDFACIDQAMQRFGFLEGPAQLFDRIGLKHYVRTEKTLRTKQPIVPRLIQHLVDQGHFGKAHGFGFYRYDNITQMAKSNHTVYDLLYKEQSFHRVEDQYIIDRILLVLCNTTLNALNDHMIYSPQDADLALVHGFGFPEIYVGPCYYIQHIGFKEYIALCNRYAHLGAIYHVPTSIQNMLAQQQLFYCKGAISDATT